MSTPKSRSVVEVDQTPMVLCPAAGEQMVSVPGTCSLCGHFCGYGNSHSISCSSEATAIRSAGVALDSLDRSMHTPSLIEYLLENRNLDEEDEDAT
jgi:hypothetical protein